MIIFPIKEAVKSLKSEEGYSSTCYLCTAGAHTVGHGRNISEGGVGISKKEAEYLLKNDIKRVLKECEESFVFWYNLTPNRQRALVEICFQLGMPALKKFKKALGAVHAQDYELASREFLNSKSAKQTPARAKRMAELIKEG